MKVKTIILTKKKNNSVVILALRSFIDCSSDEADLYYNSVKEIESIDPKLTISMLECELQYNNNPLHFISDKNYTPDSPCKICKNNKKHEKRKRCHKTITDEHGRDIKFMAFCKYSVD